MMSDRMKSTILGTINNAFLGSEDAVIGLRLYLFSKNREMSQFTASKMREGMKKSVIVLPPDIMNAIMRFEKYEEPIVISSKVEQLVYKVVKQREQFRKSGRPSSDYRTAEELELETIRLFGRGKEVDAALKAEWAKRGQK